MKVLLTGATGFLGSYVLNMLLDRKDQVTCLIHQKDLCVSGIKKAYALGDLEKDYEVIYHTAAYIPYGQMDANCDLLFKVNVDLTYALLQSNPTARFVFPSSTSVYGALLNKIHLDSGLDKSNPYAASKIAAEKGVSDHPSFSIIRFTSLVGKGMKPVTFLPKIILEAKGKSKITLFGDGSRLQNYLDIRDAAQLFVRAGLRTKNLIFLGVSDMSHSNLEVAKKVSSLTGAEIEKVGQDPSVSKVYDYQTSHKLINYTPTYRLDDTIKWMMQ